MGISSDAISPTDKRKSPGTHMVRQNLVPYRSDKRLQFLNMYVDLYQKGGSHMSSNSRKNKEGGIPKGGSSPPIPTFHSAAQKSH